MDVHDTPNYEDGAPLRKPPKKRPRKNQIPRMPKLALPAEVERLFGQLSDALFSEDLDTSCRATLAVQATWQPELRHRLIYELQVALGSPNEAVREKASTLLFILAPRLFGIPPAPPSLDDLTQRLRAPDPKVRAQAAEAIGDRGKEAKPPLDALQQALNDPDPEVQFRVAVAIGAITGSIPPKPQMAARTGGGHDEGQGDHKGEDGARPE